MSTKVLNVRISSELHKELKIQSALREQNMKELVEQAIIDFLQRIKNTEGEKNWNNFNMVHGNTEKKVPSTKDMEAIKRDEKDMENSKIKHFKVKSENRPNAEGNLTKKFLYKREDENNIVSSVNNWLDKLQEKKNRGLFDITKDPLYNIPAFDFDAPADFATNIDNYIYGEG